MSLKESCKSHRRTPGHIRCRHIRRIRQSLCGVATVSILLLTGGCSPELLVGGAIAGSVLYAHANKDNLPGRRGPTTPPPQTSYANGGRVIRAYRVDRQGTRQPEPEPHDGTDTASLVREGAQAYRELRWDDAVRVLNRAVDTGACTSLQLGQAHILLGAVAYQRGDAEAARRHFAEAHHQDGQLQPSPSLFPPPLIEFYRTAEGRPEDRSR